MPTLSAHVPDDWEYNESFNSKIAERQYRGKPGRYIRDLVERDLAGEKNASQYSSAQIDQWLDDEHALVVAAKHALKFLDTNLPLETRIIEAHHMALLIAKAVQRRPTKQTKANQQDDEDFAVPVAPKPEIHSPVIKQPQRKRA